MKKEYISPLMVLVNVKCDPILSGSDKLEIDKEGSGGTEHLSNERRGAWGNVWGK